MNLPIAITHICGHSGKRTFSGSPNHRGLLVRMFSERPCPECFPRPGGVISRAMLRAVDQAEVESRRLPPPIGDAERVAAARAIRACFVLALERYRSCGLSGPLGEEFEALLQVTLNAERSERKARYPIVHDWLQDHGLEPEESVGSLDLFAWHLGRIRLLDERTAVAWLGPAAGWYSGPLYGSWDFFLSLRRAPPGRPGHNSAE